MPPPSFPYEPLMEYTFMSAYLVDSTETVVMFLTDSTSDTVECGCESTIATILIVGIVFGDRLMEIIFSCGTATKD